MGVGKSRKCGAIHTDIIAVTIKFAAGVDVTEVYSPRRVVDAAETWDMWEECHSI